VSLWRGFMRVREGLERLHDADEAVQWSAGTALLRPRGARWRGCCISRDAAQTTAGNLASERARLQAPHAS
jgi:hypothetical protein